MEERIDWEAFKENLKASIENEEIWAMGSSTCEEYEIHMENIERMEEQIVDIENENYDSLLEAYDDSVFEEFMM